MTELLPPAASVPFPSIICEAVRDAADDFFRSSCGLKYQEHPDDLSQPSAGIMSTIAFMGDQPWSFSLVLPHHTAMALARAFAGFDIPAESPDMGDVVGEVVNVIAGGICARLDAKGIKVQMSLPTVVRGENVSVLVPSGASTKRMEFAGPNGACWFRLVKARSFGSTRLPGT
jgi:CheY-specific phosphatase CheX